MEDIKLINGDCLNAMKNIQDESIDLIITDPPYKLTSRGNAGTMSGYWAKDKALVGKVFEYNDIEIEQYIDALYRILKDGTHCYIMCNHLNLPHFLGVIEKSKFKFIKCLIWDKQTKICGHFYMGQFEYIIMLRKGSARIINNCGTPDILSFPNKKTKGLDGNNIHDSEKPIGLMEVLVSNSSNISDLILDPFMGSGTTGVACKNLKRRFIGIELDENYFKIAKRRREETQETFVLKYYPIFLLLFINVYIFAKTNYNDERYRQI